MNVDLMDHQKEAVRQLSPGKVLYGGVGSGKTRTAIAYYVENEEFRPIVVITTAKKRDSLDWQGEAALWGIGTDVSVYGRLVVDSWNNIDRYVDMEDAFFIFDEQRLVGNGAWVHAFLTIAKRNHWILLTATPGDSWMDYVPVFIANGYFRNITQFKREHVKYKPFFKYPVIEYYLNEGKLEMLRNEVLVEMPFIRTTERCMNWTDVGYDKDLFDVVYKKRWNIYEERPIKDAAEMFRLMRRIVNSDLSRLEVVHDLLKCHPRLIIFYNFDYELEILRTLRDVVPTYEWNGHRKDHNKDFEDEERWVYLVQYVAGAEAWNCTKTDAMCYWSLTYSYKNHMQGFGRIDRLDTPFTQLYYYLLVSNSFIDRAIRKALEGKKNFNERSAYREIEHEMEVEADLLETCEGMARI